MSRQLLIAGAGIGGLAAALAASRAGWQARVFEQAAAFSEVGAGIQLGPNATRILGEWGVLPALQAKACLPARLVARDAYSGRELAALALGDAFEARYGAPYLTVLRTDLHAALLQAVEGEDVGLEAGRRLASVLERPEAVRVVLSGVGPCEGDALVGADGLWSAVRPVLVADGAPRASDHVAYRALVPMARVPQACRAMEVTAWLGPRLHVVTYPVAGGTQLNVVCVVQQAVEGPLQGWDLPGTGERLRAALGTVCGPRSRAPRRSRRASLRWCSIMSHRPTAPCHDRPTRWMPRSPNTSLACWRTTSVCSWAWVDRSRRWHRHWVGIVACVW